MTEIQIDYSYIKSAVRQQLAIIGRHHKAQQGGTLFSTATLSEIEESVMPTFIVAAAQTVIGELSPIMKSYEKTDERLTFSVDDTRRGAALPRALGDGIVAYLVASTVMSVLNMSVPDIAPKYAADAQQLLAALVKTAFTKMPPKMSGAKWDDVKGEVVE